MKQLQGLAYILAIFNLQVWLNLTGFLCICHIFSPSWRTHKKKKTPTPFSKWNSFEKNKAVKTATSFRDQHHMHAAALDHESRKTLAKLLSFFEHRLAQDTVLFLSSFVVPPCSRREQTTVCEHDTDMVSPSSHRSVGTPCRSAVQLAYPSVSPWRSLHPPLDLPPPWESSAAPPAGRTDGAGAPGSLSSALWSAWGRDTPSAASQGGGERIIIRQGNILFIQYVALKE